MAVVKKVTTHKDESCAKCQDPVPIGSVAIKDRRGRSKTRRKAGTPAPTLYYHEPCYKQIKGGN